METRKNQKHDLESKRPLFFSVGLCIALLLAISAFEWKTEIQPIVDYKYELEELDNDIIFSTEQSKPEPPKPINKKKPIQTVTAIEEVVKAIEEDFELDTELLDNEISEFYTPEEPVDEVFIKSEKMPEFPGGEKALLTFLSKNIRYPKQAKNIGVEGRVTVYFVIEKDGSVSNLELVSGIGAGCDEEAMRVVSLLPNFSPGKQRGQPVRVQMIVPITFSLR